MNRTALGKSRDAVSCQLVGTLLSLGMSLLACAPPDSKSEPILDSLAKLSAAMKDAEAIRAAIPADQQLEPGFTAFALSQGNHAYLDSLSSANLDDVDDAMMTVMLAAAKDAEKDLRDALQRMSDIIQQKRRM